MTYHFVEGRIGAQQVGVISTTPAHPLGTILKGSDTSLGEGEFIYLKGAASTVRGSVVIYNAADYSTTLAKANAIGPVALAMGAIVADRYGWYQIGGKGVAKVAAGFADNGNCYLTSTDGVIDDAVVPGDYIFNMKGASAIDTPDTGLAYVEMERPFVKDGLDDAVSGG